MGVEPFFDELRIFNGGTSSGRIQAALEMVDVFVLFWSATAAASDGVTAEWQAAQSLFQGVEQRFVIVGLDDTPLPPSLAHKQYVDGKTEDARAVLARQVLGLESGARLIKSVQRTLETWGIELAYSEGYGPFAGCPECGAGIPEMKKLIVPDCGQDTAYGYLRCTRCRWLGGGGDIVYL